MDNDIDSDLEGEDEEEELVKIKQEFYINLEDKLRNMNVNIISEDEVTKFRPSIGHGTFGKVYKGSYKTKLVAIKKILLKDENFDCDENTQKAIYDITNEIKTVQYVSNSKIPIFYGIWKNKGKFNLIFEYCPGKNLKEAYLYLNENQKFSICLQLSEVLQIIHSSNLIHRDIKPSNIMIDDNLNIKLIDFGVSRIANRTSTFTNDVSGTTRYMAPEFYDIDDTGEFDKPIKITSKLDVWSTGCMISEIFSGVIPWMNAVKNEISLRKKLMQKVPFPIPNEITNPHIKEIIEKCVKVDPLERISSAELTELIKEKMKIFE